VSAECGREKSDL